MPKKIQKKLRKWLSLGLFAVIATIGTGALVWNSQNENAGSDGLLSANSFQALQSLNYEHEMWLEELVTTEEEAPLMSQVLMTNSFKSDRQIDKSLRGLVVSLEDSNSYLMLRPKEAMSDVELETVARRYSHQISEFAHVEVDQDVIFAGEPTYWGAVESEIMLAEEAPVKDYEPITIGVIDSGLDEDHEFFRGIELMPGWNSIDPSSTPFDDVGHGTHIAGIIAANAPGAVLSPYKIYGKDGGRLSHVVAAIDAAIEDEMDILNMSFGLMAESVALEEMVQLARERGTIIAAAAGNNGSSRGFYPAAYPGTLAVASVDHKKMKLPKSNWGDWVNLAAYGFQVRSTLPNDAYGYKSGNSQSTAFVSAAIARVMAAEGLDAQLSMLEIYAKLMENGEMLESGDLEGVVYVR